MPEEHDNSVATPANAHTPDPGPVGTDPFSTDPFSTDPLSTDPFSTDERISQRVNHLLFINRLTRRKAAQQLGISHSAFNTKINGASSWKADELVSLTERFGVSFDFLVGRQAIEFARPVNPEAPTGQ